MLLSPGERRGTRHTNYALQRERDRQHRCHGANRKYGGSAPDQVYASARTAYRDVAAADPQKSGFDDYPNVGAGLVTDNMGNFILAGTKSDWYAGGFSNTNVNPAHNDPVVAIAKALAAM